MNNTCAVTADLNRYMAEQDLDYRRQEAIDNLADEIAEDIKAFENVYHVDCFWEDFYESDASDGMYDLMRDFYAMASKQGAKDAGTELWSKLDAAIDKWAGEYAEKHIDD